MKKNLWLACGYGAENEPDICLFTLDHQGCPVPVSTVRQGDGPSFACRAGERIYTVSELLDKAFVSRYRLEGEALVFEKKIEVPGTLLCHLYPGEEGVYGSCYGSGDYFAVDYELEEVLWHRTPPVAERVPHAHWMSAGPDGNELFGADLGRDRVYEFLCEAGLPGTRERFTSLPEGEGPRQMLFLPGGEMVVACELGSSLALCRREAEGYVFDHKVEASARLRQGENFPGGAFVQPDGTVFLCNRGANTVAAFGLMEGKLQMICEVPAGGVWPRGIYADQQSGLVLVACQESSCLTVFGWDGENLEPKGQMNLAAVSCVIPLG